MTIDIHPVLPDDAERAALIGRLWDPVVDGPRVVTATSAGVFDLSGDVGTVSEFLERDDRLDLLRRAQACVPQWRDVLTTLAVMLVAGVSS